MMSTISRRLAQTVARVEVLGDAGVLALAKQLQVFQKMLERRLRRLTLWRWVARLLVTSCAVAGSMLVWSYVQSAPEFKVEVRTLNELVSFGADIAELGFLLLPIVVSIFLLERFLERGGILPLLTQLDLLNDQVYNEQFDDNPYASSTNEKGHSEDWLLECLDCCTALLFIIRMLAQQVACETEDRTVLEQCGLVRRGAGDNHTRILMKIGILKASKGTSVAEVMDAAA